MNDKFNQAVKEIVQAGGRPFLVGGSVRDEILGIKSKDLDIEVFHLSVEELITALSKVGTPNIDDRKFGVIRLDCGLDEAVEFALPRKDNLGERGFGGVFPDLSFEEACKRRDFTFNAMMKDLQTGEIVDPLGGDYALQWGVLSHCDDEFFVQDKIRAIRAFRFVSLQENTATDWDTVDILSSMVDDVSKLSPSAMWSEFEKWAKRMPFPGQGLKLLLETGLIKCFPELQALVGCQQDHIWHPEGDVFSHTVHTVNAAAGQGVVTVLAALCHDFGKPATTVKNDIGRWISPKHATAGEEPTRSFLARIGAPKKIVEQVVEIVREHMVHVGNDPITKRQARRLLVRLKNADPVDLFAVIEADHSGRPPLPKCAPDRLLDLRDMCFAVEDEIKPLVMGRHLIALGMDPGPRFTPVLDKAFQAQLDGKFSTVNEGIDWLKSNFYFLD